MNPQEAQQVNHDLQTAFRDAFREALYDIGGENCFAEVWKKAPRHVPLEVVYPKSGAPHLWATLNPLAAQLCDCLHQMEQEVDKLLPIEPPADHLAANVERYLAADTPEALADEFFTQVLAPYLTQFRVLFLEVNNFEPHLRRHLFPRVLIHLDEHLKQRPTAWRAFNRLLLEELRLRVRALGGLRDEQRSMSQKQEALRAWSKRIEQQLVQQASPLERAVLDEALATLDEQIRDHFEQMSAQIAAGFAQVQAVQVQIESLPERIRAQLVAVKQRLQTKATLARYLEAVIGACDTIYLPYSQQGEASLPLERVYVALRADRSSPVERRASNQLFQQLVREREAQGGVDESVIYQIAALNPYAARYLLYDEQRAGLLRREAEQERTYHLAEIVRTHRWLVLLGHPGSGKSTLARWLALQLARAVQGGQKELSVRADHVRPDGEASQEEALGIARLPIIVRIADYAVARWQAGIDNHLPLQRYLGRHISQLLHQASGARRAIYALLDEYLAKKCVIFILDGLDEVTDAQQRNLIVAQIEDIIRDHVCDGQGNSPLNRPIHRGEPVSLLAGNQLIVTSRIVGYQLRPLHENSASFCYPTNGCDGGAPLL